MRSTWSSLLAMTLVCSVTPPLAAATARPQASPVCAVIRDVSGDETQPYGFDEGRLDLLTTTISVDSTALHVTIHVRDLTPPSVPQSTGSQWRVTFRDHSHVYELSASDDVAGRSFVLHMYGSEGAVYSPLPGGDIPIQGNLDAATGNVTLTAPLAATKELTLLRPGVRVTDVKIAASRRVGTWATGGTVTQADGADAAVYRLGATCS